jgi:hypothetical protein
MPRLEVGDKYITQKTGVEGIILEIVPNDTGSVRLRLVTPALETRWTTYVPERLGQVKVSSAP